MIKFVDTNNGHHFRIVDDSSRLKTDSGTVIPLRNGIPRFVRDNNYADNFGFQWNIFRKTQLDENLHGINLSFERFFAQTEWSISELKGKSVLEIGCGAGRFSQVVLRQTEAILYSIDVSSAVDANKNNNSTHFEQGRLILAQADVYDLPFEDGSFDYVFCFGVLQHTPDVAKTIETLIKKAKSGAKIAVDFYPMKGFWTKIHAKYILRPFVRRMSNERLLALIEKHIDRLILAHDFLVHNGLGVLTRFLPLCNLSETLPESVSKDVRREWAVLDTFDQYSPEYDQPQRIIAVAKMFEESGASVEFSGYRAFQGGVSAVVRAVKN